MAATDEMQAIALRHRPHAVCIVPERREERTTEGGLEVAQDENRLAHFIAPLREAGCRVSIFIAADRRQIEAAHRIGAPVIELHTGAYCEARPGRRRARRGRGSSRGWRRWRPSRTGSGSRCTPATGSPSTTSAPVAALPEVRELNIGHFLIGEAIFVGLDAAIRRMRAAMDAARAEIGLERRDRSGPRGRGCRGGGGALRGLCGLDRRRSRLSGLRGGAGRRCRGGTRRRRASCCSRAEGDGAPLGCVGLRPMAEPGVAEMKRLYVAARGPVARARRGAGRGGSSRRRSGSAIARCGSTPCPSMAEAIALYERTGFVRTAPYYDTPVAGTVFFARRFGTRAAGKPGQTAV